MHNIRLHLSPAQLNLLCDILGCAEDMDRTNGYTAEAEEIRALAEHIAREVNTIHG